MPELTYRPAASRELGGYLALPRGEGPWPGVVVVMDALGLSDDIRLAADRLAAEGYLALAPDLFAGGGIRCVVATVMSSRSGKGPAYADIEGARQWLADRDDCTGEIGIIGFCMGGGFALMCAPRYAFAAASANYGEVPSEALTALAGACPIVASYGARDVALKGRAAKLQSTLERLGIPHDVKEYADSGHSFMNRINAGPVIAPLMKIVGMNYVHGSAEDSWRRILDFFDTHVRDAGGAAGTEPAPARAAESAAAGAADAPAAGGEADPAPADARTATGATDPAPAAPAVPDAPARPVNPIAAAAAAAVKPDWPGLGR